MIAVACCTIITFTEIFTFNNSGDVSFGLALLRGVFTLLQGSWFFHIAFVLFDPFGSDYEWSHLMYKHRAKMNTTSYFVIHLFVNIVIALCLFFAAHIRSFSSDLDCDYMALDEESNKRFSLDDDICMKSQKSLINEEKPNNLSDMD